MSSSVRPATTVLIATVVALVSIGLVSLYSVSPADDSLRYLGKQLAAIGLGVAGAFLVSRLDYRWLCRRAWFFYLIALVLLATVPFLGVTVNGARRWFRFGGFQFQPSDVAKLVLILSLAAYASGYERRMRSLLHGILIPGLMAGLLAGLVFLQPDWGTALLLIAVTTVLLLIAGARFTLMLPPLAIAVAGVGVLLWLNPLRSDRVYSWLHLAETRQGVGYQAWQARLALGSGGTTGVGLNASTQKTFLPEHRTDFMFAILGEEFGYVGTLTVLGLFAALVLSGLSIASHAADRTGLLLAAGVSLLVGMQTAINVGVVSGALPNKGLTLPFVSYGGSNLMMMLIAAGLLISVARHSTTAASTSNVSEAAEPALA